MDRPAQRWDAEPLQRALAARQPGIAVEVLASCASTSTTLLETARSGDITPRLLVAEQQTAGRGRQGRHWSSLPGASLTFSLALPLSRSDWQGLSLAVGCAIADALEPPRAGVAPRLLLKWPNDLWLADAPGHWRKLAGILIETVAAPGARIAVVGVGVNVLDDAAASAAAAGAASGAAAWQSIEAQASAPLALARIAPPLVDALLRFGSQGFAPFAAAWHRRDLLRGRTITTTQPGAEEGIAEGVDEHGALLLRGAGRLQRIVAGEVSVRPLGAAQGRA